MISRKVAERLETENDELREELQEAKYTLKRLMSELTEIKRLKDQNQNAIEHLRATEHDRDSLARLLAKTERELGRAQGLLIRYSQHSQGCAFFSDEMVCTCGLKMELNQIESTINGEPTTDKATRGNGWIIKEE